MNNTIILAGNACSVRFDFATFMTYEQTTGRDFFTEFDNIRLGQGQRLSFVINMIFCGICSVEPNTQMTPQKIGVLLSQKGSDLTTIVEKVMSLINEAVPVEGDVKKNEEEK